MGRARLDVAALAASMLALGMLVVYLVLLRQQDGQPAVWAVAILVLGAAGAGYGAGAAAPHRRGALLAAGGALAVLGLLAILTIGLPILVSAGLCLVAAGRSGGSPARREGRA